MRLDFYRSLLDYASMTEERNYAEEAAKVVEKWGITLPVLNGSPRQVAWAESIRNKAIATGVCERAFAQETYQASAWINAREYKTYKYGKYPR